MYLLMSEDVIHGLFTTEEEAESAKTELRTGWLMAAA